MAEMHSILDDADLALAGHVLVSLRFEFSETLPPDQGGNRVIKPGNELVAHAGFGIRPGLAWLALMLNADVLLGADAEDRSDPRGLVLQRPRREIIELQPGLLIEPGGGFSLQASIGIPLYGRNYPLGVRVMVSAGVRFTLWTTAD